MKDHYTRPSQWAVYAMNEANEHHPDLGKNFYYNCVLTFGQQGATSDALLELHRKMEQSLVREPLTHPAELRP